MQQTLLRLRGQCHIAVARAGARERAEQRIGFGEPGPREAIISNVAKGVPERRSLRAARLRSLSPGVRWLLTS